MLIVYQVIYIYKIKLKGLMIICLTFLINNNQILCQLMICSIAHKYWKINLLSVKITKYKFQVNNYYNKVQFNKMMIYKTINNGLIHQQTHFKLTLIHSKILYYTQIQIKICNKVTLLMRMIHQIKMILINKESIIMMTLKYKMEILMKQNNNQIHLQYLTVNMDILDSISLVKINLLV